MPDIFVDIGPMSYSSNSAKADKKYAEKAKAQLKKTAERTIKAVSGVTTQKAATGYTVRLKVEEVTLGPKTVACKLSGELLKYPKPEMVSTSLTGSGKVQGDDSEAGVLDCIDAVAESMLKDKILPTIKRL